MQIGHYLSLNRKHPDYRGLAVCLPLHSRNINKNVDLVKGDIYTVGAGSPTKAGMPQGIGFSSTDASAYLVSTSAVAPWTTSFSCSCQIIMNGLAGSPGLWSFGQCGLAIETTGELALWQTGGTQSGFTPAATIAINTPYTVGVSLKADGTTRIYVNGRRHDVTGFAGAKVDQGSNIGRTSQATRETFDGKIRDVRVWNRVMPDSTFERHYTNPAAFYVPARSSLRAPSFNAGRFFPFMHPSLSS